VDTLKMGQQGAARMGDPGRTALLQQLGHGRDLRLLVKVTGHEMPPITSSGRHLPAMRPGVSAPYDPGRRMTGPGAAGGLPPARNVMFRAADPIVEANNGPSQFLPFLIKTLEIAWVS
jgi:hypothetical protein